MIIDHDNRFYRWKLNHIGVGRYNGAFYYSKEIVKNINNNTKAIRFELGNRVRHQLRIIPELKFFVDDSLDYVERIDELLKK